MFAKLECTLTVEDIARLNCQRWLNKASTSKCLPSAKYQHKLPAVFMNSKQQSMIPQLAYIGDTVDQTLSHTEYSVKNCYEATELKAPSL